MEPQWREDKPIYVQLRERIIGMILDGSLAEGEALPSVRKVAAQFQLNPMTVMKGYQSLVDDGLVEKRRGLGMYCVEGARSRLQEQEKSRFIANEWPLIAKRIRYLDLDVNDLLASIKKEDS